MSDSVTVVVGHRTATPVRMIRARLLIDGVEHSETPIQTLSLSRTRYSRADTCDLTLAIDRVALNRASGKWFDPKPLSSGLPPDVKVSVQMRDEAHENAQWKTVFSGLVDHVQWTPTETALEVQCRDMLAKLLDMRVRQAWMNMTGPEVIKAIIAAAGLKADVSFPASMTGQFWQIEHKHTAASAHHKYQTAYDLARFIADEFGCDLYADGDTIVCKPVGSPSDSGAVIHSFAYSDTSPASPISSSALSLQMERDFLTTKNVVVHVMAWDSRQRTRAETYFSASGHSRTLASDAGTLYSYQFPGLRQADIDRKAEEIYRKIIAHDRRVSMSIPGRINLAPRDFMRFTGTNSTWDMPSDDAYAVDAVSTNFGLDQGFVQSVTLRNREASNGSNNDASQ